jgi:flagellar biosynthesis/type III secretory pathway M-ring protein FliF/YscJ
MESLKRALESVGRMWSTLSATQRVILGAAAALMVVLLVVGSLGTTQSWVRVAGPEIDASKRSGIIAKLQERNQKYDLRGSEIFVPKEEADRIVFELAGDGAMNDDAIWKFLESSDPFLGRKEKDLRYKRALEQKLSAMIRRGDFIRNASVVITLGSDSNRIGFEGSRAKASVQVEIQDGAKLTSKHVMAIANLVSKAVEGLDPDQVVITDNKLNSYALPKSDGNASLAQIWREYERDMEMDIQNRIKEAFRTASVMVRITAKNSKQKIERVQNSNPRPEEEHERKVTKGPLAAPSQPLKGESVAPPQPEGGRENEQELRTRNRFDVLKEEIENPAGRIEKISIGVLIPVEVGADGKELADAEKQKSTILEWVRMAADAPVNSVSVSFIPSKRPEPVQAAATPGAVDWFGANWPKLVLGILVLASIGGILRTIQRAGTQETVEELQALTTALTEEREAAVEFGAPGETDLGRLKQGLQEMVGRNPQSVAASLKSFMSGR